MIFSCHFPWWREDGRMKIVNKQGIPQTNLVMDTTGVTVYKFALGLFGLQIDFIGLLQRFGYCGPSIGCSHLLFYIDLLTILALPVVCDVDFIVIKGNILRSVNGNPIVINKTGNIVIPKVIIPGF